MIFHIKRTFQQRVGILKLVPNEIPYTEKMILQFIESRFEEAGAKYAVIGLSGGLDSSLVLELLKRSIGPKRIKSFFLPYGPLSGPDRDYAVMASNSCGVQMEEIDITDIVSSVPLNPVGIAKGNLMARARMLILYTYANNNDGLVIGTSNKSELLMGYFTKYGDGAADIYPIGDLFKTQVRALSENLGVPARILERPPSAGLVTDQTDEGEMGIPYPLLDQVLNGLLMGLSDEIIIKNIDNDLATEEEMIRASFKPPVDRIIVRGIRDQLRGSNA